MECHRIAVIPGDGIGKETMPEGIRVLDRVASRFGFSIEWTYFEWGCQYFLETGQMMPGDGIAKLQQFDAIYLGAVGHPSVRDHVSLWGLLLPIRREFDQYVNLRPCRLMKGVPSPLRVDLAHDIDFVVVRENVEGEYSSIGGNIYSGTEREIVIQEAVFTKIGVDRVLRYAFELARRRPRRKVSSATKSNGIVHTMPFWDERFRAIGAKYPDVVADQYHIDAMCAALVNSPQRFDVVVGSNLFGDILSDLGPAVCGSIGIGPSANINPERVHPSMFEPVHGSAPDIAGRGVANPIGQIWAGAMMLAHLGHAAAHDAIVCAIESVLQQLHLRTADLGGNCATKAVGEAVADEVLSENVVRAATYPG
jgi:tartrate dehydrogenase/decarboxylase/D-malate dehydrogenase